MANTMDSKSIVRKDLRVQLPPSAHKNRQTNNAKKRNGNRLAIAGVEGRESAQRPGLSRSETTPSLGTIKSDIACPTFNPLI